MRISASVSFFSFQCSKGHSIRAYLPRYYLNDLRRNQGSGELGGFFRHFSWLFSFIFVSNLQVTKYLFKVLEFILFFSTPFFSKQKQLFFLILSNFSHLFFVTNGIGCTNYIVHVKRTFLFLFPRFL